MATHDQLLESVRAQALAKSRKNDHFHSLAARYRKDGIERLLRDRTLVEAEFATSFPPAGPQLFDELVDVVSGQT